MKRAKIYVFSGTGNTGKVAKLYKEEFEKRGIETTLVGITADTLVPSDCSGYDYLGIAYPIHAFNAPEIVLRFARMIEKGYGKYFVIKTSGEPLKLNNVSSLKLNSIMRKKGYKLTNEYHYVMPYNMIFRHTDEQATKMYNLVKSLVPIDASDIIEGVGFRLKSVPVLGRMFSWTFRIEHAAMRLNGKYFKVDSDKCISCGLCDKSCPTNNIERNGKDFKFGNNCLMCGKCYFICPANAFSIGLLNGWKVNGSYNFNYKGAPQKDEHAKFCKKSYKKYFLSGEKRIAAYNDKNK